MLTLWVKSVQPGQAPCHSPAWTLSECEVDGLLLISVADVLVRWEIAKVLPSCVVLELYILGKFEATSQPRGL